METVDLLEEISAQLLPRPPAKIGIAVSGGGDSVALLSLMAQFAKEHDIEVHVISVDHGLREGTQLEIKGVTAICAQLGVAHHVEYWSGWDGGGNLQSQARDARYELIGDWAQANDIDVVALGHTMNDQAETVLMRMARGAGVDGLSAMSARRIHNGVTWVRPLLAVSREDLRDYLRRENLQWSEDPSNENRDFERIRMRDALAVLEPLGITVDALGQVAANMSDARAALDWQAFLAAKECATVVLGAIRIDMRLFRVLPTEIARRILIGALCWLSNANYAPRRASVLQLQASIRNGVTCTLEGCQIQRMNDELWIFRELNAVRDLSSEVGDSWDDRWYVTGPEDDPIFEVSALGESGVKSLKDWRKTGIPRAAILSLPAVWKDDELVASLLDEQDDEWSAELEGGQDAFFAALLSH